MPSSSRPTLVEALHAPGFVELLPRLVAYAARRLRRVGWGEGRDQKVAGPEAEDRVATAVEAALAGKRVWPDDMDLETFLEGIMWSEAEHRYRAERRRLLRERGSSIGEEATAASDELLRQHQLCAAIEAELKSDPDLHALFRAMESGAGKPRDRAALLGWTAERERAVHVKMNRRLAAAGLRLEPGDVGHALEGGRWVRPEGEAS